MRPLQGRTLPRNPEERRSMNRDELLAALTAERLDYRWFPTLEKTADDITVDRDDDVTCARRRKAATNDGALGRGRWVNRRGVKVWEATA